MCMLQLYSEIIPNAFIVATLFLQYVLYFLVKKDLYHIYQ